MLQAEVWCTREGVYDAVMHLPIWPSARIRFDLPDRTLAAFGCIGVTLAAALATISRLLNMRVSAVYELDMTPSGIGGIGVGTIATLYLSYMLGTAFVLATEPRNGKTITWSGVTLGLCMLFTYVVRENPLFYSGTRSLP